MERKHDVIRCIKRHPGIRYRELLRMTGYSNGTLEYHVRSLESAKMLVVERKQGAARYYPAGFRKEEMHTTGYLRNESTRKIILYIMKNQPCIFADIVANSGRARSTVSVHLNRMRKEGIIVIRNDKVNRYSLANRILVARWLSRYGYIA